MRNLFLILFMSLAGIGLTGCWPFGDGDDADKTAEQLKEEVAALVTEVNTIAQTEMDNNPGGDYTKCNEAKAEAGAAQTKAGSATDDNKTPAVEAKSEAQAAKEKAEGCAKAASGTPPSDNAVIAAVEKAVQEAEKSANIRLTLWTAEQKKGTAGADAHIQAANTLLQVVAEVKQEIEKIKGQVSGADANKIKDLEKQAQAQHQKIKKAHDTFTGADQIFY